MIDELLAAGYKLYEHSLSDLYQKRIKNDEGKTLYFINVYDLKKQWDSLGKMVANDVAENLRFELDLNLYSEDLESFRIKSSNIKSVGQIENFCHNAYTALNCIPDRDNND